ncbi:MAG: formate/nitrite transporter family protein [Sphingomonadaceae bacterium]|nr:formate/nitrite transporter family protein [Sphingomonadaceae bacterium]
MQQQTPSGGRTGSVPGVQQTSEQAQAGHDEAKARANAPTPARVVHATIARAGEHELQRPAQSLLWSGVAAGFAIMASVSLSGSLYARGAGELVIALGYPVGFLIAVMGRLQLFTEQTVVAIIPLARTPSVATAVRVARLWALVLTGNLLGTCAAAALVVLGQVQPPDVLRGMLAVSAKLQDGTAGELFAHAIPAGFTMAAIAWVISAERGHSFWVIAAFTYAISASGWAHVVAGSAEAFLLLWSGTESVGWFVGHFFLPVLAGNVVGGTGLFALLAHAQVADELA